MADDAASWALSRRLLRMNAWGGAIRIYLTDATAADPWQRRPLVQVDPRRPSLALGQATAHTRAAAGLPIDSAPPASLPASRTTPEKNTSTTGEGSDSQRRDAETARLATQLADRERPLADRDRLLREKDETIAAPRQQVQKLTKQLRATDRETPDPNADVVYADTERQFRHEVEQQWLRTVPEPDREKHPLNTYRLGGTGSPPLRRSSWSTAARSWTSSSRSSPDGPRTAPPDVRAPCAPGPAARRPASVGRGRGLARCNIKHGTASAPRLMWWKLPDNTVELGRAAAHDDMHLR